MSDEFTIDIDKALEKAKTNDLAGFEDKKPDALESVRRAIDNAEFLSGLDHKMMKEIMVGEYNQYETLNSVGRSSKKIVIEYDIKDKSK
tara:strand:- start:1006 stop:1272 length:267 start_codon:yes stop_codon:yes gene_type:complete